MIFDVTKNGVRYYVRSIGEGYLARIGVPGMHPKMSKVFSNPDDALGAVNDILNPSGQ